LAQTSVVKSRPSVPHGANLFISKNVKVACRYWKCNNKQLL